MILANGFDVGVKVLPWGTSLQDALAQLPTAMQFDTRSAKYQSAHAFGLTGILSVTLRAPAADRPVMQVSYELAARASDDALLEDLSRIFGPPARSIAYEMGRFSANLAATVRFTAHWDVANFDVGLSLYGAPRQTPEGLSVGVFYIHWHDLPAAAPYLEAMIETERWLAARAAHAEIIWQGALEVDQRPYQPLSTPQPPNFALLRAARCLRKRLLIQTPVRLSEAMSANQVLVWKETQARLWCISTRYETVCFWWGYLIIATHTNLLPAKGSGAAWFSISDLTLQSEANSFVLAELAAFLQENLPVQVSFTQDFDV